MTNDLTHDTDKVLVHLCLNEVGSLAGLSEELSMSESAVRKAVRALKRRGLCTGVGLDGTFVYTGNSADAS